MLARFLLGLGTAALALAALDSSYMMPVDDDAIRYTKGPIDDAVSRLQRRIDSGEVHLRYEDRFGYLRSVLKELNAPPSSQVLVFSKTSFQAPKISPRTPRALYFNDNVVVGFVRTGDVLEFAALDPRQGVMFYTLDQEPSTRPRFARRDVCLQCHQSPATLGIPGLMVRSVMPDWNGMPSGSFGGFITDHRSALKERWGGWYVTGNTGDQEHMGNAVLQHAGDEELPVSDETRNVTDLSRLIETNEYLKPSSDVVALMTLEHETQMTNLMTRVGWEARLAPGNDAGINSGVEELLDYMLFSGETKFKAPVKGNSGFTEDFEKRGPRDAKGRSLHDFDLTTRMFRYPCSFLIYSEAWDGMPAVVKDRVYRRLWEVLSGKDQSAQFAHLTTLDRRAITEILLATKKGLPGYWR